MRSCAKRRRAAPGCLQLVPRIPPGQRTHAEHGGRERRGKVLAGDRAHRASRMAVDRQLPDSALDEGANARCWAAYAWMRGPPILQQALDRLQQDIGLPPYDEKRSVLRRGARRRCAARQRTSHLVECQRLECHEIAIVDFCSASTTRRPRRQLGIAVSNDPAQRRCTADARDVEARVVGEVHVVDHDPFEAVRRRCVNRASTALTKRATCRRSPPHELRQQTRELWRMP